MRDVSEVKLPGVGVRHEFETDSGQHVGVLVHHDGRREILLYDRNDADACSSVVELSHDDTRTLAELLGATQVAEEVEAARHDIDGQQITWITLDDDSHAISHTLGEGEYRTRTGASIVAVIHDGKPIPSPGPDFTFEAGDVIIAVGPTEALDDLRAIFCD